MIDAPHILSLIGSKVRSTNGIQTVDSETLRIIYEQIQELSDMGDDEQARLLKAFVDDELLTGHLSAGIDFDVAFDEWKSDIKNRMIIEFANKWRIDVDLLMRSVAAFTELQPIPYRDEFADSVTFPDDYTKMKKLSYKKESTNRITKMDVRN